MGNASGVYGTPGTPAPGNVPGGRYIAASWIDSAGSFWLFGGHGYDVNGTLDDLNDLWKYNPTTQQWVWLSGANTVNARGEYGTQGVAASNNMPGSRYASASWIDDNDNLWLFGGQSHDANGSAAQTNDLWMYSHSNQQWTWVSGAKLVSASGVYGTQGTSSLNNLPGARIAPSYWFDGSGALWLFGGMGVDSVGTIDYLGDMWRRN